jgi:hypothetical protein
MDHRRFLAHPEEHRPFAGGDLFARIGGRVARARRSPPPSVSEPFSRSKK